MIIEKKKIEKIEYIDAHFSYKKITFPPKGTVISYGNILSETSRYIDVEIIWSDTPNETIFGIVIPKSALISRKKHITKIKTNSYYKNDIIAIYWNDIFAYDNTYTGLHRPTPMVTEGILLKETNGYIIIDNPETLNIKKRQNHPYQKPTRYYIPKAIIEEIKIVKRHDQIK